LLEMIGWSANVAKQTFPVYKNCSVGRKIVIVRYRRVWGASAEIQSATTALASR
jgi:hypothetical protein